MKYISFGWGLAYQILSSLILPLGIICWGNNYAYADVISDRSLNTTVTRTGKIITIKDRTTADSNLFHSFREFSILNGDSVKFDLPINSNISTIFSRVTGGSVSNIDGLIDIAGGKSPVSLFLVNPSGIMFGPNAKLNISGSFVATTANSIKFADGKEFSATNPLVSPLLTVSVPIGLQMGANAGAIKAQGLPANNIFFRPLQIFKAQTVALIGSEININSASFSNPDGRFELWALRNGEVGLSNGAKLQLTSPISADWGKITLSQSSLVDTTGLNGGAINIRGRGLTLKDGSTISSGTGKFGQGEGITVKTTEFVDLLGLSHPENYEVPGLSTSTLETGAKAGDITIETERLRIANGAWLQSLSNILALDPLSLNHCTKPLHKVL